METHRPATVVSAGIIVVDHVAAPIDHCPDSGELVLTEDCQLRIGGCASNVAINLAKLGIRASVAGCIGDDLFGDFARRTLSSHGIDAQTLQVAPGAPTSQTLVVNVRGEDRRFVHLVGANAHFSAKQITWDPGISKILYLGGMFLLDGLEPSELAAVFERARRDGLATILDVVVPGPRDYLIDLRTVLPATDFFFPNEDEARAMTGIESVEDQAACFLDMGARAVAITRGSRGGYFKTKEQSVEWEACPVTLVDGTGGGDAFTAGFISGLVEGLEPSACLERASVLGASCVQSMGATEGVFDRHALDRFLADRLLSG